MNTLSFLTMLAAVVVMPESGNAACGDVLADAFFRGALTPADYPRMKAAFARELDGADLAGKSPTHTLDLSCARRAAAFVAERCGDAAYADRLKAESRAWKTVFDRSSRIGLAQQLADGFASAIRDGLYRKGDVLPSIKELSDPHSACACTAVAATVFTMSSGEHPRERSLHGRARPCSTAKQSALPIRWVIL